MKQTKTIAATGAPVRCQCANCKLSGRIVMTKDGRTYLAGKR